MSFVSWAFVVFFIALLIAQRLMPTRASRQMLLLGASVVFYASGTPWHLLVLAVPAVVDYICALRIDATSDPAWRKRWLVLSLVSNLGLLAYFKYADFFADTIAGLFGEHTASLGVALPIGISFFTFKTMSYTIDVYRRELPVCRSFWRYALFVSFFPELVAGPIVRASVFLPQLSRSLRLRLHRAGAGFQIVLVGLTKKLLIADRLAPFVDAVFDAPRAFSQGTVAAAVVAYSLQIYCDFSGYSDMAIGIARIIGFDLPENFDMPYLATSITEFWRRWHITFSQWLRDYLYIPLGGNRRGTTRTYINLILTMLLGGLWHGARWTFVAWGLWHGIGLAVHKLWLGPRKSAPARAKSSLGRVVSWLATYAFVCAGWALFRAPNFTTAAIVLEKIVGLEPGGAPWFYLPLALAIVAVIAAHAIGVAARRASRSSMRDWRRAARAAAEPVLEVAVYPLAGRYVLFGRAGFVAAFVLTGWLVALYLFTPLHLNPFIYFQF